MSEKEKKAIEIVKQFNKENRYRDCGRINNAIDTVIRLAEKLEQEKEKNKKIEDKIKKAIKEIERRMNLANECIEQEIVIADSDSLNYGRAQAHDTDSVLLKEILE